MAGARLKAASMGVFLKQHAAMSRGSLRDGDLCILLCANAFARFNLGERNY